MEAVMAVVSLIFPLLLGAIVIFLITVAGDILTGAMTFFYRRKRDD